MIGRLAGIHPPGDHQPSSSPEFGIVGQTHMSFKKPGMPFVLAWVTSKPKPPNSQRLPDLSVQAMAKSLPPGVFALGDTNGGDAMGVPAVQVGAKAVP